MSADHLYFAWWLDTATGRPWVEHECLDGEVAVYGSVLSLLFAFAVGACLGALEGGER